MKKLLAASFFLCITLLSACGFVLDSISDDKLIKAYVKDNYGIDIVIKSSLRNSLELGEDTYWVVPTDHPETVFTVTVDAYPEESDLNYKGKHSIKDNYSLAVEASEELSKLDEVVPEINNLGFMERVENEERVYISDIDSPKYISTHLYSVSDLNIKNFKNDFEVYFELYQLLEQSGAAFNVVGVTDTRDTATRGGITLDLDFLKGVSDKKDFLTRLKQTNWEVASLYANEKWSVVKDEIGSKYFTLGSEYDDFWFNCLSVDESGDCTSILTSIYYKGSELTQSKADSEKELDMLLDLFEVQMKPKPVVEYRFIDDESGLLDSFGINDIEKHDSTLNFIEENLNVDSEYSKGN